MGIAEEFTAMADRLVVDLEGLEAELRAALDRCESHHEAVDPLQSAPQSISPAILLPPWFWSGTGGGSTVGGAFGRLPNEPDEEGD